MKKVGKDNLEAELLAKLGPKENPTITIRSDQDVEMKHVVFIMDIANKNKIKSTLAVQSK
jgi:biopolymer transport protein ExbD